MLDAKDPEYRLIAQYEARRVVPAIPLGTRGRLGGEPFEVIGYLVRTTVGEVFSWREYLLHSPTAGVRWLVEYQGHWVLTRTASGVPSLPADKVCEYLGVTYRHFQQAKAEVTVVVGEFPWTVRVGERAVVDDWIAPPLIISREATGQETTWSTGEYVEPDAVWAAFGLPGSPPARVGVGAAQPSPYRPHVRAMFLLAVGFLALAVLVHLVFAIGSQQRLVADLTGEYRPGARDAAPTLSEPFALDGRRSNVMVETSTTVSNNWVYFNFALVDEDTGHARHFGREVGYYFGRDSDGAWSEGASWDRTYLPSIPSGRYQLIVEPEGPTPVAWRVRVTRDVPRPLWLWVAVGALVVPPLAFAWRLGAFEHRRWQESDYASSGDDDDDDD